MPRSRDYPKKLNTIKEKLTIVEILQYKVKRIGTADAQN